MSLRTTPIKGLDDVRAFFDRLAPVYRDCHGKAEKLLRYRLGIIDRLLERAGHGSLVEIGCGTGMHLFPLAARFERVHGTDLSPSMIEQAEHLRLGHPHGERIRLSVAPAESLSSVGDAEADAVLCVGALEHMLDQRQALREACRVLKPGGVFVCLTPNAEYVWYTRIAPWLRLSTKHLSTDRFLGKKKLTDLLETAGFEVERIGSWTFIPRGDMPPYLARILTLLDGVGRLLRVPSFRGGLYCRAARRG
ncbi:MULTISPECIES: class I SAM-dependent methyltransferase [unclassified Methylocaldum]|jgi:ubiquinone/menaquinone biosynthesis C-methylase UbiE|uniref:class I SAM-dependent methyltransferase n=1 Tax=unclassified Methylocaldum TaxID=2622260 RepID=UPI000A329630|nr:class I SAM-dependent methyltransferase [Methylocaldum sp. RMAD-M]MBP1151397.1 2-polyprenyl-6-hydroxyphenyl methylase/3-demethylubiquinone-9 3-methyltransferase [Methylocaldum sp. RMAD-M]